MKLLAVCQYFYPEQFRINDICHELSKQKHDVTVLTGLPNYPDGIVPKEYRLYRKRKEGINGVRVRRTWEIGRKKGFIYRILNYISYMISASWQVLFLPNDFDAVYIYQLSPVTMAIPGILYKKLHKTKLVLYCLDLWPDSITTFGIKKGTLLYKIIEKLSNYIYNQADIIAVSSQMFIEEIKKKIKTEKEIVYIPQYSEEIFKKSKGKEKETYDFIFAGNIGKAQSVETIIKAAKILENNEKIRLHIVGEGSALKECKETANKLSLKNTVFHGKKKMEEMQYFYDLADAMLVTLSKDAFASKTLPGKVQTCMATGKPIIAATDGETEQVIIQAKCGICSEAENAEMLANNILKFIGMTKEEKELMAKNAYKYYIENFDKRIFIENTINLLEKRK